MLHLNGTSTESSKLLQSIFVVLTAACCLTGSKMVQIGSFIVPASAFCFVFTYILSNVIAHIDKSYVAKQFIRNAMIGQVVAAILFFLVGLLPAQDPGNQEAYSEILGQSWILVLASLVAFYLAQNCQINIFTVLKKKMKLSKASYFSMIVSQCVDTLVFTVIAFGVGHKYFWSIKGVATFLQICFTQYLVKLVFLTCLNPAVSILLRTLHKEENRL